MVKIKQHFTDLADGSISITHWLEKIKTIYQLDDIHVLQQACDLIVSMGYPYVEFGLNTAERILDLTYNQETAAAAMISSTLSSMTPVMEEKIKKNLGHSIAKLVMGVKQTDSISTLFLNKNHLQFDKLRKMLLTMASDIRVVLIKLAERLCFMYSIRAMGEDERKQYAKEILDIYAPLANRLGIGQLKWELEDTAFHYLNPTIYKTIAHFLAERRLDREARIQQLIKFLQDKLNKAGIIAHVTGRAKHIYSIYLKSQRKDINYQDIYDYSAIRILVEQIEDCYKALSLVHSLWPPIMHEFDDYIAHPKPNGYQSIHTAVMGEDNKHFEIQIRTHTMHEESEHGIAAHWVYKENNTSLDDKKKITYLRQLLDWQQDIALDATTAIASIFDEKIYVITPAGDILDLPKEATPIDFAYHIHSELGHRCRGAKVNQQIVSLNHRLQTGDKIELIVIPQGHPSRDWLNPELGYTKTSKARNKIAHWFKQQAFNQDIETGRHLLERELAKHHLNNTISLHTLAKQFQFKNEEMLFASLARGNIRLGHLLQWIMPKKQNDLPAPLLAHTLDNPRTEKNYGNVIAGASDFLTRIAQCCKPIPGDPIVGYITQGRGISIHKKNCNNMMHLNESENETRKLIDINWEEKNAALFNTDLNITAMDNNTILQELSALFSNEKVSLLRLNSNFNKTQQKTFISATVQVQDAIHLQRLIHRIQQLPQVTKVDRQKGLC